MRGHGTAIQGRGALIGCFVCGFLDKTRAGFWFPRWNPIFGFKHSPGPIVFNVFLQRDQKGTQYCTQFYCPQTFLALLKILRFVLVVYLWKPCVGFRRISSGNQKKRRETKKNVGFRRISSDCLYCGFGPDFKFFVPNSRNLMPNLCWKVGFFNLQNQFAKCWFSANLPKFAKCWFYFHTHRFTKFAKCWSSEESHGKFAYIVEICEIFAITQNLHEKCEFRSVKLAISSLSSNFREPIKRMLQAQQFSKFFCHRTVSTQTFLLYKSLCVLWCFVRESENKRNHAWVSAAGKPFRCIFGFPMFFLAFWWNLFIFWFPVKSDFWV